MCLIRQSSQQFKYLQQNNCVIYKGWQSFLPAHCWCFDVIALKPIPRDTKYKTDAVIYHVCLYHLIFLLPEVFSRKTTYIHNAFVCVCRVSGRLLHRAWKLQWFLVSAHGVQEAVQEIRLQLPDTFRQLFNQMIMTVLKVRYSSSTIVFSLSGRYEW